MKLIHEKRPDEVCADLIQDLMNNGAHVEFHTHGQTIEDDGVITFKNSDNKETKMVISYEALCDYVDAEERSQDRKAQALAAIVNKHYKIAEPEFFVASPDLPNQ